MGLLRDAVVLLMCALSLIGVSPAFASQEGSNYSDALSELLNRMDADVAELVRVTWGEIVSKCKVDEQLVDCVSNSSGRLKEALSAAQRADFFKTIAEVLCMRSSESTCMQVQSTFVTDVVENELGQGEPDSSKSQSSSLASSPDASPSSLEDSPYGDPIDLGAVGESEMQLPWLVAASPEEEGAGELGLLTVDWNLSGRSIIHVRLDDKSRGSFYNRQSLTPGLARYQNSANIWIEANYSGLSSALDLDVDWIGYSNTELSDVGDFPGRPGDDLIGFELNALYLIWDELFGVSGVGLKVGQQRIQWGVADQFNPTNTLNPNDLRDVLLFGQQASNLMAALDIALLEDWVFDLVWIPSFRAALLPKTGDVSVVSVDRVPFYDESLRWRLHVDRELAEAYNKPTVVDKIVAKSPDFGPENQSVALRLSGVVARQDLALSYTYGFRDLPVPTSTNSIGQNEPYCVEDECVDGLIANEVVLEYPRQQVVGLNLTGEIPVLGGQSSVGYRFEAAMIFPELMRAEIQLSDVQVANFPAQNGAYDYSAPDGGLPVVYDDAAFLKWTLGFDYTLTREIYLNAMWVHGFVDEFGAGDWLLSGAVDVRAGGAITDDAGELLDCRGLGGEDSGEECITEWYRPKIADYLVLGADYRLAENRALFRLFAIWEVSGYTYSYPDRLGKRSIQRYAPWEKEAFSAVLFPQFSYFFSNGFEAEVGGLLALGRNYTRFGDPAVGGSLVWSRFRVRY